jgi:hypothetical protein
MASFSIRGESMVRPLKAAEGLAPVELCGGDAIYDHFMVRVSGVRALRD